MSQMIALGGVACTTKTTILKKLKSLKLDDIEVHLHDYKELNDLYNFDPRTGGMLFAAYRTGDAAAYRRDYKRVHVFDRQPMEALVYAAIHHNLNDSESLCAFLKCKKMGLCDGWVSVVLEPADGTEEIVVEKMRQRDNKLDVYSTQYVIDQKNKFNQWRDVVGGDKFTVDWRVNVVAQQDAIVAAIRSKLSMWREMGDGVLLYGYRLPLLTHKIAAFDLSGVIVVTKSGETFSQNSFDWKIKHENLIDRFTELLDDDYTIIIMTDEASAYKTVNASFKRKIETVCRRIGLPVLAAVSCSFKCRKPNSGLFERVRSMQPLIDLNQSFYCGGDDDDKSSRGVQFAANCGIKFYNDVSFFLSQ
ncbi:nicotinamide riboside kinase 1 [Orgyia leucostigma nucleopolyhedrovirus]|uniref:Nicotinamide riboside kinase 1 n=1 Tax=Orgyia leucostigma nucleopolyhedrovirus TaxID=490711 RepID=B0FDW6_9ABAC|nr:nicotinamide riboside kinase 1 [Orgyia leucostigma nucleopolyhedrovirus]ABY65824.1 nicotinamide riboside kinase 1 [Orgyia leucostigma nucleopolyhedrovirus]